MYNPRGIMEVKYRMERNHFYLSSNRGRKFHKLAEETQLLWRSETVGRVLWTHTRFRQYHLKIHKNTGSEKPVLKHEPNLDWRGVGRVSLADSNRQKSLERNHEFVQARLSIRKIAEPGGLLHWYLTWKLHERYARKGEQDRC